MTQYVVRRLIDLSDTDGGSAFHQYIGMVTEDPEWSFDNDEDRVRAIIEKAYAESTLDDVRRSDPHKVAKVEAECDVEPELLSGESATGDT